jgi:hypothetical protein
LADARKEGKELFEKMVARGEDLEASTHIKLEEGTASVKETIADTFGNVSAPPVSLEDIFNTRILRSIKRIGTPMPSVLNNITEQLPNNYRTIG